MGLSLHKSRQESLVEYSFLSRGYLRSSCNSGVEKSLFFLFQLFRSLGEINLQVIGKATKHLEKRNKQQSDRDAITVIKLLSDRKAGTDPAEDVCVNALLLLTFLFLFLFFLKV